MDRIKQVVPGVDWDNTSDETKLVALGVDSVLLMEVCAMVEEISGRTITEDEIYEMTVGDVKQRIG